MNTDHLFTEDEIASVLFLKLNLSQQDKVTLLNILGFKKVPAKSTGLKQG